MKGTDEGTHPWHPEVLDDAALDRLLADAAWPAMDDDATARLRQTLRDARPPRRAVTRPSIASWAAGLAASVAAGLFVAWPRATPAVPVAEVRTPTAPLTPTPPPAPPMAAGAFPLSRPANLYERLVVGSTSTRVRPKAIAAPVAGRTTVAPTTTPTRALTLDDARRALTAAHAPDADAVRVVANAGDAGDLGLLRRCIAADRGARRVACDAIAGRADPAGVAMMLALVGDEATRPDALAAAGRGATPAAIAVWAARLDAPRADERLAAARAVGATCDEATLRALAATAVDDVGRRRPAIVALLTCRSPEARRLVADLGRARDPAVAAQVAAVRAELALPAS